MAQRMPDGWTSERRGWSIIWTHPRTPHAIVDGRGYGLNPGIRYMGVEYATLREAKEAALK